MAWSTPRSSILAVLGGKVSPMTKGRAAGKGSKADYSDQPFKPPHAVPAAGRGRGDCRQHLGGVSGPQEAEDPGTTARTPATTRSNIRRSCSHRAQAGKGRAQYGRRGQGFRQALAKILEADYYVPHLAHATMEPPVALADFRDGKCTLWAPTQSPQAVQETVAAALGIPQENVICHVSLLGGGFGRKSKPDYAAEAAILSKAWASRSRWCGAARTTSSSTTITPCPPCT